MAARELQMGERAFVVYERSDELYNLHYSHWGGQRLRLKHELTPEMPFGGCENEQHLVQEYLQTLLGLSDAEPPLEALGVDERLRTLVDPTPLATGVSFEEILTQHLDFLETEAVFVVSRAFEVVTYRAFWLGLDQESDRITDSPTVGHGVLRRVYWQDGEPILDDYDIGRSRGVKSTVAEFVDRRLISQRDALLYMTEAFRSWGDAESDVIIRTVLPQEESSR